MSTTSESYADIAAHPPVDDDDEVDSLPSSSAGSSTPMSPSEDLELSDAEREWKESIQQLQLLLSLVLVPYVGKFLGRKCAYWGWAKFMEWKYPVTVEITHRKTFNIAGAVEAAASL